MSEPTLTDEQREALRIVDDCCPAFHGGRCVPGLHLHDRSRDALLATVAVVAAMLADEHAAREAAEAKVRDLIAAVWALAKEHDRLFGDCYATSSVRRLLDDSDAALAEVRAETLRNQRDFFKAIDMPAAADHCEQNAIGWDSSADDARRRAEAEGAGR